MISAPVRVGIIVTSIDNAHFVDSLKYLVLYQNVIQQSFEFQFLPIPEDDKFLSNLTSDKPVSRSSVEKDVDDFLDLYRKWLADQADDYDLSGNSHQLPIVILTTAKFDDNFFLTGEPGQGWGIIALGNWERYMASPSIVEFFLNLLLSLTIDFACERNLPQHQGTRGCISDFTVDLSDARYPILSGFICAECCSVMATGHSEQLAKDAKLLLGKDWLGSVANPSNVATTAKKLGYDLFHTKGISPTAMERARAVLVEESTKTAFRILGAIVIVALLLFLGLER